MGWESLKHNFDVQGGVYVNNIILDLKGSEGMYDLLLDEKIAFYNCKSSHAGENFQIF